MKILKSDAILITGATGLVGSYMARYLCDLGYTSIHAIIRPKSKLDLLENYDKKITWHQTDLNDVQGLTEVIQKVNAVIHCAACVSFDPRDKKILYKVNVEGTALLANLCLDYKVKKLIHISSIAALGRSKLKEMISEEDEYNLKNAGSYYAKTKYLAEMEVLRAQAEGCNVAIVCPGIILGSGYWTIGSNGFFKHVLRKSPFYPPGSSGFVDVRDIAIFIEKLFYDEGQHTKFTLVGENSSYHHLLNLIGKSLKVNPPAHKLNNFILQIAWRLDHVRSIITRSKPMLTKETAETSQKKYNFDNLRSKTVDSFQYTKLEKTIADIGEQYLYASKNEFKPMVLSF